MLAQRTDLRFLLARPPRSVALLGHAREAVDAFALVGIDVVDGPADLVLAPATLAAEAAALGGAVALEGFPGRAGRSSLPAAAALARAVSLAGRRGPLPGARPLLTLPDVARPSHLIPLDRPGVLRYGVHQRAGRASRIKALRNRVAPALLGRGLVPADRALALRAEGPPFLVAAAGLPSDADVLLSTGSSDLLSRGVLFVFAPGGRAPEWAIKFGRVPGAEPAFDRDAAGLAVAEHAGETALRHAPRLLSRFDVDGLPAAVETAAAGETLLALLESADPDAGKRAAVDRIAAWIVDLGRATAARSPAIAPELERLRRDVLPRWPGAPATLLDGLEALPAVVQHNDLGTWNVLVHGDDFTAVDWESARTAGLPLWDLVYFLSYAILALDGVAAADQERHLVDVYLGRRSSSALLFGWIRRGVEGLGLDPDTVGALALTGWLHHGLSHVARDEQVRSAGGEPADTSLPRRLARRWLDEPGLGVSWREWQR